MNPHRAYQQHAAAGRARIDALLVLFDGLIGLLEQALPPLQRNDRAAADPLLTRARVIVGGLAAGIDLRYGALPQDLLRLYEFASHQLGLGTAAGVEAALRVLTPLREGLEAIRPEAVQLERDGLIPPLDSGPPSVRATA